MGPVTPEPYHDPVQTGRRLQALLAACHPEPAALVTALTSILSVAAGRGWGVLWVAAAVASGQLAVGWSNDYLDRDVDLAQGRLDKPLAGAATLAAGPLSPAAVGAAALSALAVCAALSLAVGAGFAAAHLVAVGAALAYNLRLKYLPVSVVPYALAFGLLPAAVTLGLPAPRLPQTWAVAAGALIGAGGHFTQALPDIPADRRMGSRGLPQVVGQRASAVLAAGLLCAASLVIAVEPGRTATAATAAATATALIPASGAVQIAGAVLVGLLAAAVVAAGLRDRPRLAFRLTLAAAAAVVLQFLAGGSRL